MLALYALLLFPNTVLAAESNGTLLLDLTPDVAIQEESAQEFIPRYIRIVELQEGTENRVAWEGYINQSQDMPIPLGEGNYTIYIRLEGSKTLWEYRPQKQGLSVLASETTIAPLSSNTPLSDVISDAPWRVEPSTDSIPILIMIKDANYYDSSGSIDFSVDKIHVYLDNNQDECERKSN